MDFNEAIKLALEELHANITLKPFQEKVVASYSDGEDCFCVAPTGAGKSLIFKVAPLVLQSMRTGIRATRENLNTSVLIIQPLRGLMKEQSNKLCNMGMKAIYLGEGTSNLKDTLRNYNYIICSPETASSKQFCDAITTCNFQCIFVDESHCIKTLGHADLKKKGAFRTAYGDLGMLRAQLPGIPVVALTATATASIRSTVIEDLGMADCTFVTEDANRTNIRYTVLRGSSDYLTDFQWLIDDLAEHKISCPRVLIFCQDKAQCSSLFELFLDEPGEKAYVVDSTSKDDTSRLFGMYHRSTREDQKKTAEKSFADPDGHMRVLFCTSSFGMGMDVKACQLVIHLGPPKMLDAYLQESGRIGRDGHPSHSIVLLYRHCLSGPGFEKEMKEYAKNSGQCRRVFLLKAIENPSIASLEIKHACCDICAEQCMCLCMCDSASLICSCTVRCTGPNNYQSRVEQHLVHVSGSEQHTWSGKSPVYKVSDVQRELFKLKLEELHDNLLSPSEKEQTVAGLDVTTGFTSDLITDLTDQLEYISSESMLLDTFPFYKQVHASLVYSCVKEILCEHDKISEDNNNGLNITYSYDSGDNFGFDTDSDVECLTTPVLYNSSNSTDSESEY